MGLQDVTYLTGYDFIVAVTERAINMGLDQWLGAQEPNIALYYTKDASGNYVAADSEADATIILTGTLAPTLDANRKPIDLITLFVSAGSRTVQYNLTMTGGVFQASSGTTYKQTRTDPWIIHFNVDLGLASIAFNEMPADVQQTFQDSSLFSYQQLGADLSTAVLDTVENVDELNLASNDGADFAGVIAAYLKQQQGTAQMIFGLAACFTANDQAATPSLYPTSIDFCISQYSGLDPAGHALDTLNYLTVTGGDTLPATPSNGFGFNWVDSLDEMGAVAVRRDLIVSGYLMPPVSSILPLLSPQPHADAKGDDDKGDIKLLPCSLDRAPVFGLISDSGNLAAQYSYNPSEAEDKALTKHGYNIVKARYESDCFLYLGADVSGAPNPQDKLSICGNCSFSGSLGHLLSGGTEDPIISVGKQIPPTTYSWSAVFQMQADLTKVGQLDFNLVTPNFNSPPVVNDPNESTWEKIFEGLSGSMKNYVSDISGVGQAIHSKLSGIVPNLKGLLIGSSAQVFVFPGSQSFLPSNPQFTPSGDLVANINYYQAD